MTPNRRVAAIDVGTNTVLLLVVEQRSAGVHAVVERATITRLGEGVDRTGTLSETAMSRTTTCLERYAAVAREHGAETITAVCTSAARDAVNGAEFLERASAALGTTPRIIAGEEEARLTFGGALSGLDVRGDVAVFDIGGGSTEIIHGVTGPQGTRIVQATSLDVGTVRLTERHVKADPPHPEELAEVRRDVLAALARVERVPTTEVVGVAGTVTTLAAIAAELSDYDGARVHGSLIDRETIERIGRELGALSLAERRRVTGLEPGRADVIVAGAELVLVMMEFFACNSIRVSDRGVRWGLALNALT